MPKPHDPKPFTPTVEYIKELAGAPTFNRGRAYYNKGALSSLTRQEDRISGYCQGSRSAPYQVWVQWSKDGIAEAWCSCPSDWGPLCKHQVALLLAYHNGPEHFIERPGLDEMLAAMDKPSLENLVRKMIAREPHLQAMVERAARAETHADATNLEELRDEILRALDHGHDEYGEYIDESEVIDTIRDFIQTGETFGAAENWRDAAAVYCMLIQATLDLPEWCLQEDDILEEIDAILEHLATCLRQEDIRQHNAARTEILTTCLALFIADTEQGYLGIGDGALGLLHDHVQGADVPALRAQIAAVYQPVKPGPDNFYQRWKNEAYESVMVLLDSTEGVSPQEILRRLRQQDNQLLVIRQYLRMNDMDGARETIRRANFVDVELATVLAMLCEHGHDQAALELARECKDPTFLGSFCDLMVLYYEERENRPKQLEWLTQRMLVNPSMDHYTTLRNVARESDRFDALMQEVLAALQAQELHALLAQVHLDTENWEDAWATLEHIPPAAKFELADPPIDLRIALAAANATPTRSAPILVQYALAAIDKRKREHYAYAADLLKVVHDISMQSGSPETKREWEYLIEEIRVEFRRLRALQEELTRAGL